MIGRKLPVLAALALLFAALLFSGGCGKSGGMTTLAVNEVTHSVFYAPFYAAMELGYFAEEGLELELTNGGGSDNSMTALITGAADIALVGPETAVYVHNEGKEDAPVIIGQVTKKDGAMLLAKEQATDFQWSDLAGSTVLSNRPGSMPEMALAYVMREQGLTVGKDVTVPTDVDYNLLAGAFTGSDKYDYVILFEPAASTLEQQGQGYIVASVGQAAGNMPYTCFVVLQSYLDGHAVEVQAFLRALYRGQRFCAEATAAEIAAAIAPSFPDNDADLLTAAVQTYLDIDAWKTDPLMEHGDYRRLLNLIIQAGVIEDGPGFEQLVNNAPANLAVMQVGK